MVWFVQGWGLRNQKGSWGSQSTRVPNKASAGWTQPLKKGHSSQYADAPLFPTSPKPEL